MYISMNWIEDFVDLTGCDIKDIINRVTLSTAEVEHIYEKGKDIDNVVVGKILSIENHPNSKQLHILKVDKGVETVTCVCGASNIFEGALVPFVSNGGRVGGIEIVAMQVAGVLSSGMCCSEKELGISDDNSGVMILDDTFEVGKNIKEYFDIDDIIFEIDNKSLTNRPDLWGHYGMAREIAALAGRELKPLQLFDTQEFDSLDKVKVAVEREDRVFRYSCISVENITKKKSPVNMKIRLYYCGMRPINLLADLTNYLMLELGQPMHAFDNSKVKEITVKTFEDSFSFKTLDDLDREIDSEVLMICNQSGPIGIAGIMGGKESEIEDHTNSVLLESANFEGVSIRKSASKLGLRTEASSRYEKVLDPELTTIAIMRFLRLLSAIDENIKVTSSLTDLYMKKYDEITIKFDKAFVDKYTGIDISEDKIISILLSLGFKVDKKDNDFVIVVPTFRATKDITMKVDVIEEITRIYGYDNFELKSTQSYLWPIRHQQDRENEYEIKKVLAEKFGMTEVHSYIWYDKKMNKKLGIEADSEIKLINSLASDNDTIRTNMAPTLLCFVNKNIDFYEDVNMFEFGHVVKGLNNSGLCDERKILSGILTSKTRSEKELLSKAKQVIDFISYIHKGKMIKYKDGSKLTYNWVHPNNSSLLFVDDVEIGYITLVNPIISAKLGKKVNAVLFEIDYNVFSSLSEGTTLYREPSKYPGIEIDFSLLVNKEDKFEVISDIIEDNGYEYLLGYSLIDIFHDEKMAADKKSITIRLKFGSDDRTLFSEDITGYTDRLLKIFEERGITLRT